MPVKNISHNQTGIPMTRVPVRHKVALGLPRGYKETPSSNPLVAPKKLFHFIAQSRNNDGEWAIDEDLQKRVFGDEKKPKELKIQLVGNEIEDMVISDLFYWHNEIGAKCSCGTVKTYFEQWCEENDVAWEYPLSGVRSESELILLIAEKKVHDRVNEFIRIAKVLVEKYIADMEGHPQYDFSVSDIINSSLAIRRIKKENKSFPCAFRKCPDYAFGRCKYNGRFFFLFDGDDIGDIATLVTTSPKNIKNIQWGLENIIGKVVRGQKKKGMTLHGISCRLVGVTEKGMYTNSNGKQSSTKFFIVSLKGPHDKMVESGAAILKQAREMIELYPDGMKVEFDEGDLITLSKERLDEFTNGETSGTLLPSETKEQFKVIDEARKTRTDRANASKAGKKKPAIKEELLKLAKNIEDEELVYMIGIMGDALEKLKITNGSTRLAESLSASIKTEEITVEKILLGQSYIDNLGNKINLEKRLKVYQKKQTKKGVK